MLLISWVQVQNSPPEFAYQEDLCSTRLYRTPSGFCVCKGTVSIYGLPDPSSLSDMFLISLPI